MSQRVNITYSVNVEELPEEVMRLLRKGEPPLDALIEQFRTSIEQLDEISPSSTTE